MYFVYFPAISVFVGLLVKTLNAFYGFARAFGLANAGPDNQTFQATSFVMFLCFSILQVVVQVAYEPGDAAAAKARSV
jgi:hypothetical protein